MRATQSTLIGEPGDPDWRPGQTASLEDELRAFHAFGTPTTVTTTTVGQDLGRPRAVDTFVNEFWTSKQRDANSLHEISYRACFKPQLPRFFVDRLSRPGDVVYDPFMGRGTTPIEAALLGRIPAGCDANPLGRILTEPRLEPPTAPNVAERLASIDLTPRTTPPGDLLVFFHPKTLEAICGLRDYLIEKSEAGTLDAIDRWIRMVAVNRLTGHSRGFFSVYTLPPNQAVSATAQRKINADRHQTPPFRDVPGLIALKTRSLLADCSVAVRARLRSVAERFPLLTGQSDRTPDIPDSSVRLVVTSPPFLDVVDYLGDNWLRLWFCGIDRRSVQLTVTKRLDEWSSMVKRTFQELERILGPDGNVAFEVGEIQSGKLRLEETVIRCGMAAGLDPRLVLINDQTFTKTSNLWGVTNLAKGTNTNRVVLFHKGTPSKGDPQSA